MSSIPKEDVQNISLVARQVFPEAIPLVSVQESEAKVVEEILAASAVSVQPTLGLLPDCAQAQEQDYGTKVGPRHKGSRSSKDQHADLEDQDQPREAGDHQEKSLPCQAGETDRDGVGPGRKSP